MNKNEDIRVIHMTQLLIQNFKQTKSLALCTKQGEVLAQIEKSDEESMIYQQFKLLRAALLDNTPTASTLYKIAFWDDKTTQLFAGYADKIVAFNLEHAPMHGEHNLYMQEDGKLVWRNTTHVPARPKLLPAQ